LQREGSIPSLLAVMGVHSEFFVLVPLTFDLDIQTRQSEGSNMSSLCKFGANPFSGSRDISYTNKKQTSEKVTEKKNEPYAVYCCGYEFSGTITISFSTE